MTTLQSIEVIHNPIYERIVYEGIVGLEFAPLTKLVFRDVEFVGDNIEKTAQVIERSKLLYEVDICTFSELLSPLVEAVKKNPSVGIFKISGFSGGLDSKQNDCVFSLIQETKTLRELHLSIHCRDSNSFERLIQALIKNESLETVNFFEGSFIDDVDATRDQIIGRVNVLNQYSHSLLSKNSLLREVRFNLELSTWDLRPISHLIRDLADALNNHCLDSSIKVDVHMRNPHWESYTFRFWVEKDQGVSDSYLSLRHDAANVAKLGRVLTSAPAICGKVVPYEIIDHILLHVSVDGLWDDQYWKPIRRVVMDRRSIGKIRPGKREFSAYELLYLCRRLSDY